ARDREAAKKTRLHVRLSDVAGPGTRSCDLHLEPLVINGRSISKELMDVRKSYFDGSRDLETMDDLLVMNFIFTEKFIREHFSEDIVSELFPREDIPPLSEADSQCVTTAVQLAKEKGAVEFERFAEERTYSDWKDPLGRLFYEWSSNYEMREDGSGRFTKMNTATYMHYYMSPILKAFFSGMGMAQCWGDSPELPKKYRRDFFLLRMFGGYRHLTMMVLKMTKRDVKERHRAKDERELFFSMKVSLDLLMKANVKDPEVVGLLVRGNVSSIDINVFIFFGVWTLTFTMIFRADSRIEFFTLRIQHEALYFPRLLGIMEIPRKYTDFDCLFEGLPVVLAARSIVSRTLEAVKSCAPDEDPDLLILDDSEHPLCRPSFYIED
ncbi:hypothetical protein BGX34_000732, partial [Mortierella sp. NVP85]